jgi:multisubunit Na+/H+ antiporter MnhF subunit
MSDLLAAVLYGALIIHIGLLAVCVWRLWRGENVIDRLLGADVFSTLVLGVLVLVALLTLNSLYIDVALGLAALGFIGTIALAKFVADRQVF